MTSVAPRRRATDRLRGPQLPAKLYRPRRRNGLVPRQRLVELLARAGQVPLVLVDAPPGWGKSTLLAEWSVDCDADVAWVSLDSEDNDPTRFWSYVIAALAGVIPKLPSEDLLGSVRLHGVDVLRDVVPALVDDLATLDRDLYLVLDDYHVVTNPDLHRAVTGLLEVLPERMHLVIASRSDPPLGLAQLRARGDLLEVRAEHLRFTAAESTALVNNALDHPLGDRDIARLHERTEGWAVGLQLAALTLRDRADTSAFVDEFTGDDRHVVDYLVSEVLDGLPHDTRSFLLRTSLLHRMSSSLCDEVLGADDSADRLLDLEHRGLFLVPLDRQRRWFRYHHLFGELLRHDLAATDPAAVPDLHRKASSWWERDGDVAEAVHHAAAADDPDLVRRLVATHWRPLFNQGLLATVQRWIELLPKSLVIADEQLSEAAIWTALDRGRLDEADDWLTHVEHLGVGSHLGLLRALHAFKRGDLETARELLELMDGPPEEFAAVVRLCLTGVTDYWQGDFDRAEATLAAAATSAELSGNSLAQMYAHGYRALALVRLGALERAEHEADAAWAVSKDPAARGHFVAMAPTLAQAQLAELRARPEQALERARAAVDLAGRGAGLIERAAVLSCAAHLERTHGDPAVASALGKDAAATAARCPAPGPLVQGGPSQAVPRPRTSSMVETLTERELSILRMLPGTATNRELANALFVSPNTMKTHLRAIYRKMGVATREQAVEQGATLGLLAHQAR
jgi:LuxR family maltose regulon positive regulatory protein